jgi:uncharacterized membrane protein
MDGAARFRGMNMRGSTPKKQMQKNGTNPWAIDAAEGSIVVKAPVADVYKRWLACEDYPKFIDAIKQARKLDENHFFASVGLNGEAHDAILEIMLRVPERRLAWRTVSERDRPDHLGAGVVSFASRPDKSTCVNLKLTSSFGGTVSDRVDKYLQNFKKLVERDEQS